jgi:outer membrane protein assembly factor BamB
VGTLRFLAAALTAAALVSGCGSDDGSGGSPASPSAQAPAAADVDWPIFGRVTERTHYISEAPDPPFHYLWEFFAKQLIEFPPALEDGQLFVVNKTGEVYGVHADDGKVFLKANLADDVTGPAYADGTLYLAQVDGLLTALDPKTGERKWSFKADSELESSPLIAEGRVYFGSDHGYLYALDAGSGKVAWRTRLGNDIKASPSFSEGTVYVGDYEGSVFAVDAQSGRVAWSVDTTKVAPGGDGGFYSSPAVAFDHVYEARDDGTVYALDQRTGKVAWHFATSNSIYSSPAAAQVPGTPASIYVGSYNHNLYALDAQTGRERWRFDVGGEVPGTPTVVGHTVYTSSFQNKKTFGLDARTGEVVFRWGSAGYTPLISDGERVFLTGFQTVWAFDAKRAGN